MHVSGNFEVLVDGAIAELKPKKSAFGVVGNSLSA